jgi:hypothetical protein
LLEPRNQDRFGQYIGANTNLNLQMAHFEFSQLNTLDFGILYYAFYFHQPAQFNNPLITSKRGPKSLTFIRSGRRRSG